MDKAPVYYCLECGYVGNTPGNCPECKGVLLPDDVHLPNETDETEKKYDDELLGEELEVDKEETDDKIV